MEVRKTASACGFMEGHRFIIHSLEVYTGIETSSKQAAANNRLYDGGNKTVQMNTLIISMKYPIE